MNKIRFLISIVFVNLIIIQNSYGNTKLSIPYKLKTEDLNKEEKYDFKNIDYTETLTIPNQYKGKLKYTESEEKVQIQDARLYFGIGGRYTLSNQIKLTSQENDEETTYFNKENKWDTDGNFNFYSSLGLYWNNGIRLEFEYSEMLLETNNYGKDFAKYNGTIFNQYLQNSGTITNYTNSSGDLLYTALTDNMLPITELSVKTYMLNIIFEKTNIKSKLKPYFGFGFGIVNGDITSFVNEGSSTVLGGQVLVGLSYPISKDVMNLYLGYRGLFSQEMEQTFTRISDVEGYNGDYFDSNGTYYNPVFMQSKEKYRVKTHNIDLGIRFFF